MAGAGFGRLVVIEGLDGSGKATQTALLENELACKGRPVRKVSFPNYESDASALVKMYLAGEFGAKPDDVNAFAASAFYAVDRYASYKQDWGMYYNEGGLVLADRYTTSNAIHQCAKLPRDAWEDYVRWLEDFEYFRMDIPGPDLVICLWMQNINRNQELVKKRDGEAGMDIHEKDLLYLVRCHEAMMWCAQTLGWRTVQVDNAQGVRPANEIHQEVLRIFEESGL